VVRNHQNRDNRETASDQHDFMDRIIAADPFDDHVVNCINEDSGNQETDGSERAVMFFSNWGYFRFQPSGALSSHRHSMQSRPFLSSSFAAAVH
jgi:hypothetical protein